MNQNKVVREEEFEGGCKVNETVSAAKQDLINMFADDFSLEDQKDVFIDGDGRWTDFDDAKTKDGKVDTENAIVFYSFKMGLTARAVKVLKQQSLID